MLFLDMVCLTVAIKIRNKSTNKSHEGLPELPLLKPKSGFAFDSGMGVWQGVAIDSLKFQLGTP
jgi:hypothetical protein